MTAQEKQDRIDWAEAQLRGGSTGEALGGFLTGRGGLATELVGGAKDIARAFKLVPGAYDPTATAKPKTKETAKQKADAAAAAQKAQTQKYEQTMQQIANSPWTTAANALTNTMSADLQTVASDTSGASGQQAVNAAASQGLGMLGLSPSSSAGQWLASQTAASQQNAAPVQAAMNAESQTYANMGGPISKAIAQWGQDNALTEMTAPEQAWLSALGSHATSLFSYYSAVPTAAIPSMPGPIREAIKVSGGQPGSAGAGITPVQNIPTTGNAAPTTAAAPTASPTTGTVGIPAPTVAAGG